MVYHGDLYKLEDVWQMTYVSHIVSTVSYTEQEEMKESIWKIIKRLSNKGASRRRAAITRAPVIY